MKTAKKRWKISKQISCQTNVFVKIHIKKDCDIVTKKQPQASRFKARAFSSSGVPANLGVTKESYHPPPPTPSAAVTRR